MEQFSPFLETGFDGRTHMPTMSSLLSKSGPVAWERPQSNMATGVSDHTPCMYIGMGSGNGREAFWKTLQYQIKPQQTTPD